MSLPISLSILGQPGTLLALVTDLANKGVRKAPAARASIDLIEGESYSCSLSFILRYLANSSSV